MELQESPIHSPNKRLSIHKNTTGEAFLFTTRRNSTVVSEANTYPEES